MERLWAEEIRHLTLSDILLRLEEDLTVTIQDPLGAEEDVFIRIAPDADRKFAYTAEVRGIIKYHGHDVTFATSIKQSQTLSILLEPVSGFDINQRAIIEVKALETAMTALNSPAVQEARAAVIKYQMLQDLIHLLES
jgi:hypothetical protein